jgi:hypothetical protein
MVERGLQPQARGGKRRAQFVGCIGSERAFHVERLR